MRLAALLLALAAPAAADEAAIRMAWESWVTENDIGRSTLAITRDGVLLSDHGSGMAADAAVPIASLSKAITGACILALRDEGLLDYDTPLSQVFANRPDLLGNGGDMTVAGLLTQTSGLDFDRTQTVLNPGLWGAGDLHDQITALALSRSPGPEVFFYNNENFAVLGSIIAEVTGKTVADACAARVLADQPTAAPHGRTGGGLAWGGWEMSVADYAIFASGLEVSDDWPAVPLGSAYYGPGVFMRNTERGTNLWHFGGFCLLGLGDHGAYFYVLDNGWGVAVWYDICASSAQAVALDNALAGAAYSGE